jgi:opacity protein-like surface antigen
MRSTRLAHHLAAFLFVLLPLSGAAAENDVFQPVDLRTVAEGDRRFYLSGIVGSSWGTLTVDDPPSVNEPLFTAGGAAGVAFERATGRLRLEFEGRYRDPIGESIAEADSSGSVRAANGWSTMVNLWRDVDLTERLGIYAGGGIGAGGYRFVADADFPAANAVASGASGVSSFAWQAGGGVLFDLTERVSFDLGYRFFSIGPGSTSVTVGQPGVPLETLGVSSAFSASELLLTIRIYEPFRGWR